ncbi:inositol monophosphatase family protein [Quadrisphaera sp. DSM 44207]|uniref:inositol monophosphatase family protein n=1 Tax=Quadrisphaera sp. DSM 44207 TaxID=1881057 RepID=UPI001C40ADC7|nr:inositol monophosphatase family protein [Quadrisphaera sp. DSM 44207]
MPPTDARAASPDARTARTARTARSAAAGDHDVDEALLAEVVAAAEAAGERLLERSPAAVRPRTREEVVAAIRAGDAASLAVLRPRLQAARPGAGWVEDELDDGALPAGEWWVVDPVEGAINHVHGLGEWAVTATLVRDGQPLLAVVHLPLARAVCTAVAGGGARLDGAVLRTSGKTELSAALVGTGQASPRESAGTFRLIGRSVTAMMAACGVARVSVPPTLQLLDVAAGRTDVFWQHSAVRSGLLAGALLVTEAGGTISDLHGKAWSLGSRDFLATAPALHSQAVDVLSPLA